MICPDCKKLEKKSRTYECGSYATLGYTAPFYDENGNYHNHDRNLATTTYRCSNGHTWTSVSGGKCWCGWSAKTGVEGDEEAEQPEEHTG